MPRASDLSLYLVTDPVMTAARGLLATVDEAVAGGVTIVQFRHKEGSMHEAAAAGRALRDFLRPRGVPLIVNDRIDLAQAIGADGVHVGQSDLPSAAARAILGSAAIIGLSITGEVDLQHVDAEADYFGLGPLFPTGTKADAAPALGVERFRQVRSRLDRPTVAIGGLTLANAGEAIRAGADGVAVVSAICAAADPRGSAQALRRAVETARRAP